MNSGEDLGGVIALLIAVAIIVKFLGGYWGAAALVVPSFRGRRLGRWYRRHPALSTRYCDGLAVPTMNGAARERNGMSSRTRTIRRWDRSRAVSRGKA
ncbi:hypothetical protein AWC13_13650 [Mycobacterium kubicae]|nr:hypothetical protein AWC13_13650 [Mycobacterium kubicae]